MTDSTKRSLRTAYQTLIAAITTIPLLIATLTTLLPEGNDLAITLASIVAGIAVVSKVINALEDHGLIPAWLKGDTTVPEPAPVEPEPGPEVAPGDELEFPEDPAVASE